MNRITKLSKAEKKALNALAATRSYKGAAAQLNLSLNTIKMHLKRVYKKLGVHKRNEVIRLYVKYISDERTA